MTGRAGKPRNIFLVWLVWPILTLGVYHFVWYYKINREARDLDGRIEVNPAMAVVALAVGWLIIVPPFISVFNTGDRISRMQRSAGMQQRCNPWIGLILALVMGLYPLYYQYELNRLWEHCGSPAEGAPVVLAA